MHFEGLFPVPGFPLYFASRDGNVWSMMPRRIPIVKPTSPVKLKKYINGDYYKVTLCKNGVHYEITVARIMLTTFSGKPKGRVAMHGPQGKLVDSIDNLRWGTYSENALDRRRDGTSTEGEKHPMAKLTWAKVAEIRKLYSERNENGHSTYSLAALFGVTRTNIAYIVRNKTWIVAG